MISWEIEWGLKGAIEFWRPRLRLGGLVWLALLKAPAAQAAREP